MFTLCQNVDIISVFNFIIFPWFQQRISAHAHFVKTAIMNPFFQPISSIFCTEVRSYNLTSCVQGILVSINSSLSFYNV